VLIHIEQGTSAELLERLTHGELDIALIYGRPNRLTSNLRPLLDVPVGLVAPPTRVLNRKRHDAVEDRASITLAEVAALPLIFPGRKGFMRNTFEQEFSKAGLQPNVALQCESLLLSKELVKTGIGYTLLSYVGVYAEVEAGALRFIPLSQPAITWRLSMATRGTKSPSLAVKAITSEIIDAVKRANKNPRYLERLMIRIWSIRRLMNS